MAALPLPAVVVMLALLSSSVVVGVDVMTRCARAMAMALPVLAVVTRWRWRCALPVAHNDDVSASNVATAAVERRRPSPRWRPSARWSHGSFGGREFARGPRDGPVRGYLQSCIPDLILC